MANWARSAARLLRLSTATGWRTQQNAAKFQWQNPAKFHWNLYLPQKAADFHCGGGAQWCESTRWMRSTSVAEEFRRNSQAALPVANLLSKRGLATHLTQPRTIKLYVGSPGIIGEPYTRPPPKLPFFQGWFTKAGWQQRKERVVSVLRTAYTIARLRQKSKGYTQKKFYREAVDLYKQINTALAGGDRSSLRKLVTESAFSEMKKQLKQRDSSPWARVDWELAGPIKSIGTVHGRLVGFDQKNHDNSFVQLTLRILSYHKFAAYDKNGKLVAGDPEKEVLVEDFWVFEKLLTDSDATWRLCGRLFL